MSNEENLYARIITGDLTAEEIKKLKSDGDWDAIQAVLNASDDLKLPEFNAQDNFRKLIENTPKQKIKSRFISNYRFTFSVAAGIALLVGLYFLFGNRPIELKTQNGLVLEYTLPDNSNVVLNVDSKLSFVEKNWKSKKIVELQGEAFFDVKSGESFTVKTNEGEVTVLGTKFNVKTHDKIFKVECYSGKVRVQHGQQVSILEQNESIYFDEKGIKKESTNSSDRSDWLNGRSIYKNEKIENVLNDFSRQFDVEVVSDVHDINFTGAFQYDDIDVAASQIAKPLGLNYRISNDRRTVFFSK